MRLAWIAHQSPDYLVAVELRRRVLRFPLGLDFSAEQLASEQDSHHLACWEGDALVGSLMLTAREHGEVQMRQVAVAPEQQGRGVGRLLADEAESYAVALRFTRMILHARDSAVPFYEKLGYACEGEPFTEVGILHRHMAKPLR
jgi:predicted GNAT family N-acyltransferase